MSNKTNRYDQVRDTGRKVIKPKQPVYLDCENTPSCGLWVLHRFVEDRPVHITVAEERPRQRAIESIFGCSLCGHKRRFGLS